MERVSPIAINSILEESIDSTLAIDKDKPQYNFNVFLKFVAHAPPKTYPISSTFECTRTC